MDTYLSMDTFSALVICRCSVGCLCGMTFLIFFQQLETLQDPIEPVEAILKRCNCNQIMLHYNVSAFSDVHEFLALLARRLGMLRKGGIPDKNKAARRVLQDWNECVFLSLICCVFVTRLQSFAFSPRNVPQ